MNIIRRSSTDYIKEMEKERLAREKAEQEKKAKEQKIKEEYSDTRNEWEKDKQEMKELELKQRADKDFGDAPKRAPPVKVAKVEEAAPAKQADFVKPEDKVKNVAA